MTPSSQPKDSDAKQRLTADTIHDLRTPLTVIKAQAQMVRRWLRRRDIAGSEVVLARLAVIDEMVTRLVSEMDERRDDQLTGEDSRQPDETM